MISWESKDQHIFLNPKMNLQQKKLLEGVEKKLPSLDSVIWLASSGSTQTSGFKLLALKKQAFLASAEAVNSHIQSTSKDVWLKALPDFHVGGLSLYARAHLSGATVIEGATRWDPQKFINSIQSHKATLASVVPTQLYDLITQKLSAPKSLRVLFVGGGNTSDSLYSAALELGWPMVLTYGMTEACSQIATSELSDIGAGKKPEAKILNHIHVKESFTRGLLEFQSPSLFEGTYYLNEQSQGEYQARSGEWFQTSDFVEIRGGKLQFLGRSDSVVKILGEAISLHYIQTQLEEVLFELGVDPKSGAIRSYPHPRTENEIELYLEIKNKKHEGQILSRLKSRLKTIESPKKLFYLNKIPKTPTGKIKKKLR